MSSTAAPQLAAESALEPWMSEVWLDTWWEHFGQGRRRLALEIPPWGVPLPLLRERGYSLRRLHGLGLRCLRGLGSGSQRCTLRCAPDEVAQVAPAIAAALARRSDWDWLEIDRLALPQAQMLAQALRAAGLPAECAPPVRQRYVPLDRPWPQVAALGRPSLAPEMAKKDRALRRLGDLEFVLVTSPELASRCFEDCLQLEASGWKGRAGSAILSSPANGAFYRALVRRLAAAGQLRLAILTLNANMLAFSLNVAQAGALASLKIGYSESPEWRKFSPGQLLQWLLLRWAQAEGLQEFDLLGGDDATKAAWTPYFRELTRLRAHNRTWRGRAAELALRWSRGSSHDGACAPVESPVSFSS